MAKLYAATSPEMSGREKRNMDRVRKAAPGGMVLLENDGTLPLKEVPTQIALYGSGARRTVKGGTGSGDVNSRQVYTIEDGFKEAGIRITTTAWMDRYDQLCGQHMQAHMGWIAQLIAEEGQAGIQKILEAGYQEPAEPPVSPQEAASDPADLAVYVLSRNSGEGKDRHVEEGDYLLSEVEMENLKVITAAYDRVIVVLNVGGVIDTQFLRTQPGIGAILLMSQAGNIGGCALADVITGKAYPSGRLAMTWAKQYSDYPCADTFSYMNGDTDDEYYEEGLYVGYRYFDTFGVEPAYPFGYGLSYTTFALAQPQVCIKKRKIRVSVRVKNTGAYPGRQVVQVYASAPQGKIAKPYQALAGFAKTRELLPGETEELVIGFKAADLASFDESNGTYVLEAGGYVLRVGTDAMHTKAAAVITVRDPITVCSVTRGLFADAERVEEISPNGAIRGEVAEPAGPAQDIIRLDLIPEEDPAEPPRAAGSQTSPAAPAAGSLTLDDVRSGAVSLRAFTEDLSIPEMALLCVGTARGGLAGASTIGAASTVCPGAAGDTTSELLESRKIPNMVLSDGPAGLRLSKSFVTDAEGNVIPGLGESSLGGMEFLLGMQMPERPADAVDRYQYCTAIPIATMLAQSWDVDMIEEMGDIIGEEMEELGIHLWLAPGMNIQRNPLCGRNFEYYSEDPLLSGKCAAAETKGVQRHKGKGVTIKHFALNNQEDNRSHLNAHCNERAIREIYLRGFQITIRESQPLALMTSYNLLNGVHTANSCDLLTKICRGEWGYEGLIMTDWGTTGGGDMNPDFRGKYGFSSAAGCIHAGNDLIMPGSQQDVDEITEAAQTGMLGFEELRASAERIIRTAMITQTEE